MSLYDLFQSISKGEYPPINDKYSEELRSMIDSMLKVNPGERLDVKQVVELCDLYKKVVSKKPRIDPYLIMDDIIEKLRLLDYENAFCRSHKRKPISRIFFACKEGKQEDKVEMFYEMSLWLINMSRPPRNQLKGSIKELKNKIDEAIRKQIDIKNFDTK